MVPSARCGSRAHLDGQLGAGPQIPGHAPTLTDSNTPASGIFDPPRAPRRIRSLLTPAALSRVASGVAAGFVLALKGSTGSKKLHDVGAALTNFFASGPLWPAESLVSFGSWFGRGSRSAPPALATPGVRSR